MTFHQIRHTGADTHKSQRNLENTVHLYIYNNVKMCKIKTEKFINTNINTVF